LIFPLAWQHSYIQPAGSKLAAYAESPTPVIFCCSPLQMGFEHFLELEEQGMTNLAILDIDGSYTNNKEFCKLENEAQFLRTLNQLKNKSLMKLDYAFSDMIEDEQNAGDAFV
jgi:hypothetical protein